MLKLTKVEEKKLEIWAMAGLIFVLATSHLHNMILNFIG